MSFIHSSEVWKVLAPEACDVVLLVLDCCPFPITESIAALFSVLIPCGTGHQRLKTDQVFAHAL